MSTPPHHPFRFGAVVGALEDGTQWAEKARTIEDLGYSTLLLPDTLRTPSPFPALAAAAAVTTRLKVGPWVLSAPLRTPESVARDADTLRRLSENRFELGIGAGRPGGDADTEQLGETWGTPKTRVDRVEATLQAVLGQVSPTPRVVVAAAGPRMLRLAGTYADAVAMPLPPTATEPELVDAADRIRAAAGPRGSDIELVLQLAGVGGELPPWIVHQMGLDAQSMLEAGAVAVLDGDAEQMADRLRQLREVSGVSAITVPDMFAQAMAPVVRALTGT
ncbi:MAG: LLM class flavin-dependent oxidoreductase [Nocardioidaceae bacterium]